MVVRSAFWVFGENSYVLIFLLLRLSFFRLEISWKCPNDNPGLEQILLLMIISKLNKTALDLRTPFGFMGCLQIHTVDLLWTLSIPLESSDHGVCFYVSFIGTGEAVRDSRVLLKTKILNGYPNKIFVTWVGMIPEAAASSACVSAMWASKSVCSRKTKLHLGHP